MDIGVEILRFGNTGAVITWFDLFLLIFCPIGALLGTSVSSAVERKRLYKDIPERWYQLKQELINKGETIDDSVRTLVHEEYITYVNGQYKYSKMGNNFIAIGLGLVVSLYFFGAITQNVTSITRVVGLCVLLGYQATNIWSLQERAIVNFAEDRLKTIISAHLSNTKNNNYED